MNKWVGWLIAMALLIIIVGYGVGTVAHTLYYMIMVVFSKITFGLMYGLIFVIGLGMIMLLFKRK